LGNRTRGGRGGLGPQAEYQANPYVDNDGAWPENHEAVSLKGRILGNPFWPSELPWPVQMAPCGALIKAGRAPHFYVSICEPYAWSRCKPQIGIFGANYVRAAISRRNWAHSSN